MKLIKTEDALGCMLCHDITQIIPGVVKDAGFAENDLSLIQCFHFVHLYDVRAVYSMGSATTCFPV